MQQYLFLILHDVEYFSHRISICKQCLWANDDSAFKRQPLAAVVARYKEMALACLSLYTLIKSKSPGNITQTTSSLTHLYHFRTAKVHYPQERLITTFVFIIYCTRINPHHPKLKLNSFFKYLSKSHANPKIVA
jgi:membrane-bound acyltransferase YfiQ involved in biofilm formation